MTHETKCLVEKQKDSLHEDMIKLIDAWEDSIKSKNKEIEQLKNEIINLKTEIVDHRIKEYRLIKILNETSDHT